MQTGFSKVVLASKSRVTFYGPGGWGKVWILSNSGMLVAKWKQLGSAIIMIWAGVVDKTINELFKIDGEIELNCANYCNFMDNTFFVWYEFESCRGKMKYIFMHDNAPTHIYELVCEFFGLERF